jgi:integrase
LIRHFGETPLPEVDQAAIDKAATTILPNGAPDYRNRAVYAPVSAILHHALGDKCFVIRRPKGAKGRKKTDFMWPADAFAIIEEADRIDAEFGLYLRLLIYTGIRKGEGLALLAKDVQPAERAAWLRDSKNEDPRMLRLRDDIVAPLQAHLDANKGERLFRFNDGGHFKHLLMRAKLAASACSARSADRRLEAAGEPPRLRRLPHLPPHMGDLDAALWRRRRAGPGRNRQLARCPQRRALQPRRRA